MSLLIPSPKSPGREIDVYLQPLIEELKELWTFGVRTYDSLTGQFFQLYAALLWTINDFPTYGDLSGWSTKGYQACPICMGDRSSFGIRGRISFMGHRRYLPQNHVWRRSRLHYGKVERKAPPVVMNGHEILEQLDQLEFPIMSKHPSIQDKKRKRALNWTKKSIFFDLPYWSRLLLRHKLDVMHIEKNVCDNLVEIKLIPIRKHLRLQRQHAQNSMDLYKIHERAFPEWFRTQVLELHQSANLFDDFFSLAIGPSFDVRCYNGCIVGGVRFYTIELDSRRTTQNSGIMVIGESDASGTSNNNLYGVLDEVLHVQYPLRRNVSLFKCRWYDTDLNKSQRIHVEVGYKSLNTSRFWYAEEPVILATQGHQVFYVDDPKNCSNWKVVQVIQNKRIWDVPEVEDVQNDHINILEVVVSHQMDDYIEDNTLRKNDVDHTIIERPIVRHITDDFIDNLDEHLSHASDDEL
ncbi:uncharacterized protein E5676_scaffold602G001710 [Cucumis melo var. makuwa]|uniref:DUF4216 domain-containing protein n=1 Tax=Cucumis melo var. makuwa TaxID=1194695 RepID=A0A5A7VKK6_CUCMM|nr:uncharacterized protein E6C27_scaffold21G003460 [Cucumis melo var. makuwa]TYK00981.1 uncharacterized protein E5676_scaffold602G001710 [Cucumis melo var. makuwa]